MSGTEGSHKKAGQPSLILDIKGLSVAYGGIQAVSGLDLAIEPGKIIALIGANGAGKSTILRAISGLIPKAGQISFNGRNITDLPAHEIVRAGISHVPEGRHVFATLSVRENLEIAAYTVKDKKKIKDSREQVLSLFPRLAERQNQLAGTLSGGEQQMLALGRALMTGGILLLLDEPSLGLAPVVIEEIFRVIKKINSLGTTILLVEQDAYMALENSDFSYVLEAGRLVIQGSSQDLLYNPRVKEAYLGG